MSPSSSGPSYRALLAVPSMSHIVASLFLSRTAHAMSRVALILFTLAEFGSPALAGIVTFASFAPGILASPIAGALLDRHGRVRLIAVDFLIAMGATVAIGLLSLAGRLSAELLVVIAIISSLTAPLSMTGLRSLFPLLVPGHLWERANAIDSNAFVTATMIGPLLAASAITLFGPGAAMLALGIPYGLAVLALRGVRSPDSDGPPDQPVLRSAWHGVGYVWRNRTLRGLGIAIATQTFAAGVISIVVPLIVLRQLGGSELAVGLAFGLCGLAGMISVLLVGRIDSRGREWRLLVLPMLAMAPLTALLLVPAGPLGAAQPILGFAIVAAALLGTGLLEGPLDIGLFTMRQRRTEVAWIGRAFAISMAVNALGYPIGAAVAGSVAEASLQAAVGLAVIAGVLATALAVILVPRSDGSAATATQSPSSERGDPAPAHSPS